MNMYELRWEDKNRHLFHGGKKYFWMQGKGDHSSAQDIDGWRTWVWLHVLAVATISTNGSRIDMQLSANPEESRFEPGHEPKPATFGGSRFRHLRYRGAAVLFVLDGHNVRGQRASMRFTMVRVLSPTDGWSWRRRLLV